MNKKALVIEDDKNIAELLRLYLEKDGFEVTIASDGGAGLRLAGEVEPDSYCWTSCCPSWTAGRSARRSAAAARCPS